LVKTDKFTTFNNRPAYFRALIMVVQPKTRVRIRISPAFNMWADEWSEQIRSN